MQNQKLGNYSKVYRQTGSHIHIRNEERNLVVTVPNHPELAKGTLISIMKQARLEKKEFIAALKELQWILI